MLLAYYIALASVFLYFLDFTEILLYNVIHQRKGE